MGLESRHPVHDVDPCPLEPLGPFNVPLFVKTGFELHKRYHLLSRLRCCYQRPHDRTVAGGAIERHLDGQNVRIDSRSLNEPFDRRRERIVGVLHQKIALAEDLEDIDRLRRRRRLSERE